MPDVISYPYACLWTEGKIEIKFICLEKFFDL
jgi:hypothetical protein